MIKLLSDQTLLILELKLLKSNCDKYCVQGPTYGILLFWSELVFWI